MPNSYYGAIQLTVLGGGGGPPPGGTTVSAGNNISVSLLGTDYNVALRRDQPIRLNNSVPFQGTLIDGVTPVDLAQVGADDRIKLGDAAREIDLLAATEVVLPWQVSLSGYDSLGVARILAVVDGGDTSQFGDAAEDARGVAIGTFQFDIAGDQVVGGFYQSGLVVNGGGAATAAIPPVTGGISLGQGVALYGTDAGLASVALAGLDAFDVVRFGDLTRETVFDADTRWQWESGSTVVVAQLQDNGVNAPSFTVSAQAGVTPLTSQGFGTIGGLPAVASGGGGYWGQDNAFAYHRLITVHATTGATLLGNDLRPTQSATGWIEKRTATAVSYAALATDYYIAVTSTAAPRTIDLPASAPVGTTYWVADESGGAGTNAITIDPAGAALIDGAATIAINTNFGARGFYSDGTNWHSVASANLAGAAVTVAGTAPITVTGGPAYTVALSFDATRFATPAGVLRPQLANNVFLQGVNTSAALVNLVALDNGNIAVFGSSAAGGFSLIGGSASRSFITSAGFYHVVDTNAGIVIAANGSTLAAPPAGIGVSNQSVGGSYAAAGYFGRNAGNSAWLQGLGWGAADLLTLGNATGRTALGGGWIDRRTPTAVSYVVLASDHYVGVTSTAAARTITLPASPPAGTEFVVADESGGAATIPITVAATTSTINGIAGATGLLIGTNFGALIFTSDGTNYTARPWQDPSVTATAKPSARTVSLVNVAALSGTGSTINGVTVAAGDVVMLVAQSTGANNGPWVVQSGTWLRPAWFSQSAHLALFHTIAVREGSFARATYLSTNLTAPTLGTTALTYEGAPALGVQSQPDNSNLLALRRGTAGTLVRNVWIDSAGNVSFGDTSAAATLLVGNNDIRLTTTNSSGNSASNYGISNTLHIWNMASGISAIDHMQLSSGRLILGQRENTTAAIPALVFIRGSEPASTQSNTSPSGGQWDTGRGRGTADGTLVFSGWDPAASGTTFQSVQRTAFTIRGRYTQHNTGRARNQRTVTGATATATIVDDVIRCTNLTACVVTLPAANAVPSGWELWILDPVGSTAVTASPVGADTVNSIGGAYGGGQRIMVLVSDGISDWAGGQIAG